MANSCCQESYTECNKIVTIAYLKSFVGNNIQNTTNGSAMSVNSSDDNYCPTYGELVGGSLVQNHVAAASGRWSDDVDGITVSGGYANNECVRQEDLSLTYTRFKSLTSSVGKTTFDQCSDRTDLTYIYTLTRTKKSMNPNCTVDTVSTEGTDTNNAKITNTSSNTAFTATKTEVSAGKNGPTTSCPARAPERDTTITTKVNFRGAEHSSTVSITQRALDGKYEFWKNDSQDYGYGHNTWNTEMGCEGGYYGYEEYHMHDSWQVWRWVDNCGTPYDNCTEIRAYTTTRVVDSTDERYCTPYTQSCEDQEWTTRLGGYQFHQFCEGDPSLCGCDLDCYEYVGTYGSCSIGTYTITVNCDQTGLTVPGTSVERYEEYKLKDPLPSGCAEDCSEYYYLTICSDSAEGGYVEFGPNTGDTQLVHSSTVGGRPYRITQRACPSCKCEPTYSLRGTYSAPASGATNMPITWNKTYASTCSTACTSGTVVGHVDIPCNSGSARDYPITYEYTEGNVTLSGTVRQASGTPATCGSMCECYSATTATGRAQSYSSTTCTVKYTLSHRDGNGNWTSSSAETVVNVTANTTSSDVTQNGTFTLSGKKSCDGNDCGPDLVVNWTAVVPGNPCTCADVAPTGTTAITMPQSGGTYQFTYSNCVGGVRWNSGLASLDEGTRTFTITLGENDTTSAKTYNIVFTYYLESNFTTTCGTYTVEITQAGKFECPEYDFRNSPVPGLDYRGGTARFEPYKKNG